MSVLLDHNVKRLAPVIDGDDDFSDDFDLVETKIDSDTEEDFHVADSSALALYNQLHLDQYSKYPYLTQEEEQKLAQDFYHNQTIASAHKLVLAHMRYVVKVARGYLNYGLPFQELVQEGAVGLMKAVKKFDPYKGVRLISFAMHWIRAEVQEYILKNWRLVKIATTKAQRKLFFNYRKLAAYNGDQENSETQTAKYERIAKKLDLTVDDVEEMAERFSDYEVSIDAPLSEDGSITLGETLISKGDASEDDIFLENTTQQLTGRLHHALNQLSDRDKDIIQSRFLSDSDMTLKELAMKFDVSVERIRQIEKRALQHLRENIEKPIIKEGLTKDSLAIDNERV